MISYKERLNTINTFIFDIDGVFTDGKVLMLDNEFYRTFNSKDIYAIQFAAKMGYQIFIITSGSSIVLKNHLIHMGVTEVHLGAWEKELVFESILASHGINASNVLFMGDDLPDYQCMVKSGVATCPQDAVEEIKRIAHYQSPFKGGENCVRDVIEQTMRVQNKWFKV